DGSVVRRRARSRSRTYTLLLTISYTTERRPQRIASPGHRGESRRSAVGLFYLHVGDPDEAVLLQQIVVSGDELDEFGDLTGGRAVREHVLVRPEGVLAGDHVRVAGGHAVDGELEDPGLALRTRERRVADCTRGLLHEADDRPGRILGNKRLVDLVRRDDRLL